MATNALTALRLAMPGEPSLRDLALKLGCSHEQLRKFEAAEAMLSDDQLGVLSKLVRLPVAELKLRFWRQALANLQVRYGEIRNNLATLGVKDARFRRGPPTAY